MRWYFVENKTPPVPSDWPFYCPQTTPDYDINYSVNFTFTTVNYCPQTTPNYAIAFDIILSFTTVNYCPQTIPDYSFAQAP